MSDRRPNRWLSLIAWLLPSCGLKTWVLRALGNQIGQDVFLGITLVLGCGRFSIADGAVLHHFNVFRNLTGIELGPKSIIGQFNQFTAAVDYQQYSSLVGKLTTGESAMITNRHYFDCSGHIILRPFAAAGGIRSIFQSHELLFGENKSEPGRIVLDRNAVVLTGCILLKDSYLPERSILAAGSVLPKAKEGVQLPVSGLYGGSPARFLRELSESPFWDRANNHTPVEAFNDAKFRVE